jgi:hypothetical protein
MTLMERAIVLTVAPASRGLGYALFVTRTKRADWGVKEIRSGKNRQALAEIEGMLRVVGPVALVTEVRTHKSCRRSPRVQQLAERRKTALAPHIFMRCSFRRSQTRGAG